MIAAVAQVDDREAWRRLVASLAAWTRGLDGASEGLRVIERDGLVASVTPAAPERSVVNSVVYENPAALSDAYGDLEAGYDAAGVHAWMVWVPDTDSATAELLADRGHLLDADPEAMVLDLDEIERPPEPPAFGPEADPRAIGELNDVAYGTPGSFTRALARMAPREGLYAYTAGPGSCLLTIDHEDDCSVWLVATVPAARGQGLAGALMAHALADARERGRTTSTLQATDLGRPVYERLGYRSLGEIQMWERRR